MESAKLKNVVILLLVCVNLILGGTIFYKEYLSTFITDKELSRVETYLASCGIRLEKGALGRRNRSLEGQLWERDAAAEEKIAASLLQNVQKNVLGGGVTVYNGDNGRAVFRYGRAAEITLDEVHSPESSARAAELARSILKRAGIYLPQGEVVLGRSGLGTTVTFGHEKEGCEVVDADIAVSFTKDGTSISGCLLSSKPSARVSALCRPLVSLVADFAVLQERYGLGVSEITWARYAYLRTVSDDGGALLIPVCVIVTDGGEFVINAADGSLMR